MRCNRCHKGFEDEINHRTGKPYKHCPVCRKRGSGRGLPCIVCGKPLAGMGKKRLCDECRAIWHEQNPYSRPKGYEFAADGCRKCKYELYCKAIVMTMLPTPCQPELCDGQEAELAWEVYPLDYAKKIMAAQEGAQPGLL